MSTVAAVRRTCWRPLIPAVARSGTRWLRANGKSSSSRSWN